MKTTLFNLFSLLVLTGNTLGALGYTGLIDGLLVGIIVLSTIAIIERDDGLGD